MSFKMLVGSYVLNLVSSRSLFQQHAILETGFAAGLYKNGMDSILFDSVHKILKPITSVAV